MAPLDEPSTHYSGPFIARPKARMRTPCFAISGMGATESTVINPLALSLAWRHSPWVLGLGTVA